MILENIDWDSILESNAPHAKAIRYAERWAFKTELAVAHGTPFEEAIERCEKEARGKDWDSSQYRAAIGVLYACWPKYGDKFCDWYRRKKGRNLSEWPTLEEERRQIVVPRSALWLPGDTGEIRRLRSEDLDP